MEFAALLEGACCLLEILAASADAGALFAASKARPGLKNRRDARARGEPTPALPTSFWIFLVLLVVGVVLTLWVILKWAGALS